MFARPAWLPACLALVPFFVSAQAVAARPAAPASHAARPASAAPSPAIIDPAARDLFTQMVAAQRALQSFVVTIDAEDQTGGKAVPRSQGQSRIAFSAPASVAVTVAQQGKTLGQLFSSGTTFTRVDTRRKEYRQDALPAADAPRIVGAEIGNLGLLPRSFADPSGLLGLMTASGLVAVARGTIAGPINGVPVDSVVARLIGSDTAEGTFTFVMGQGDHLLRQVIVHEVFPASKSGAARDLTHTETVTALQTNPALPASEFAYKPGSGFKKVTSTH